jgi:hypothetical protein
MKSTARKVLVATVAVTAAALIGQTDLAQAQAVVPFAAPPQAATKDLDPQLKNTADLLGLIRTANLVVGNVNILEYDGRGKMTDWETPGAKEVDVDRYTFNVSLMDNATRVDFQGPNTQRTIRVAKGTMAWDETWSADNKLSAKAADANNAIRKAMMWLEPHAIIHAAVYAANKRCPDAKPCADIAQPVIGEEGGRKIITVTADGNQYKVILGPDQRPARIEGKAGGKTIAANYFGYRNGTSLGAEALDKFHNGTYWPSRVTMEIDGTKVLDVLVTAGYSNPYSIYPSPAELAKVN